MRRHLTDRPSSIRRGLAVASVVCLIQVGAAGAVPAAKSGEFRFQGRSLTQGLQELQARGLKIVFTSQLVTAAMIVEREPEGTEPREILDRILQPFALSVREGPGGSLVVIRAPDGGGSAGAGDPAAGDLTPDPVQSFADRLEVSPSRLSLLQRDPAAQLDLSREEILALPHLSDDIFRALSLLPGVASNDITAQFHVRGGRRDETQILLDGQELYEAFHLQDYDSALSLVAATTLDSADLSTGGFSVEFGDRMGGVLDMKSVTPTGGARGRIGIGVLSLSAGGSGALKAGKGSWIAEIRRGTIDFARDLLGGENPEYWDAFGKFELHLGERQTLRFNTLHSVDRLRFEELDGDDRRVVDTEYENSYLWATHLGMVGPRLFVETAVSGTRVERDRSGLESEEINDFAIRDLRRSDVLGLRQEWGLDATASQVFGWGGTYRGFDTSYDYERIGRPAAGREPGEGISTAATLFREAFNEYDASLFAADTVRIGDLLSVELGLRWDRYTQTEESHLSPRLNLAWNATATSVIRLAWGRFLQSQRPYELQVEDGEREFHPVELAEHRILGYETRLAEALAGNGLTLRIEAYQRTVSNPRVRYENLYEPLNTFPEAELDRIRIAAERSRARGFELFLRSRIGPRFGWWINYALASTEDRLDGDWVPRSYDQRHAVNLDLDFRLGDHWALNLAWRYHSGWPTTPLGSAETVEGEASASPLNPGPLNSERLSAYHRLDLRASRQWNLGGSELTLYVDIQNLYDRENLAGFDVTVDEEGRVVLLEETWAGILPSAGLRLEF